MKRGIIALKLECSIEGHEADMKFPKLEKLEWTKTFDVYCNKKVCIKARAHLAIFFPLSFYDDPYLLVDISTYIQSKYIKKKKKVLGTRETIKGSNFLT